MSPIYFGYNASTPVHPAVRRRMGAIRFQLGKRHHVG
jgi:hypothetical protein